MESRGVGDFLGTRAQCGQEARGTPQLYTNTSERELRWRKELRKDEKGEKERRERSKMEKNHRREENEDKIDSDKDIQGTSLRSEISM